MTAPDVLFELPEIMGRYTGRYTPMPLWFGPICGPCWIRAGRILPTSLCRCADGGTDIAAPGGPR
jgi:hypothetical protein